jgi:SAM-dependent methyltransferase
MPPHEPLATINPVDHGARHRRYHDAYALRRERSTMARAAVDWLVWTAASWQAERGPDASPMRILSVGCGDGNLDLPMLQTLSDVAPVAYTGVDVNEASLEVFRRSADAIPVTLLSTPVEHLDPELGPFDLVIVSHMLYYVEQPAQVVERLLCEFTRTDGRLVVIHSGRNGIPALMAAVPGLTPFLTAEDIVDDLTARHLRPAVHWLHTELDATDVLGDSPEGRAVLGFCIEADLDTLPAATVTQLQTELTRRCGVVQGRRVLTEEVGTLTLHNHLRATSTPTQLPPWPKVDPLEDYHRLAEAFAWPERLATMPASNDGQMHLLDVGCGTGRWLRVLASTFPELAGGTVRYHALDPVATAIAAANTVAATMFEVDRSWNDFVQQAALPAGHFGLVWAVHSLYGIPAEELPGALEALLAALHPHGTAVIALPDASSFYIQAAQQLLGHTVFVSADDVRRVLDGWNRPYQRRHMDYHECIPAHDASALQHYVWMESIGNTFLPSGAHDNLPELPEGPWWESHRQGDTFAFAQHIEVILIPGGQ